jgi:hypothetical protein
MLTKDAKESVLEIQVNTAPVGHNLDPFEPVEVLTRGYEVLL